MCLIDLQNLWISTLGSSASFELFRFKGYPNLEINSPPESVRFVCSEARLLSEPEHRSSVVNLLSHYLAWRHAYTEIRSVKNTRCSHAVLEPALNDYFPEHKCDSMRLMSEEKRLDNILRITSLGDI